MKAMVRKVKNGEIEGNSGEKNVPKDDDEDDAPKGQKEKSLKMKAGTARRSGSKAYDDTPLPEGDDEDSVEEEDDAEDREHDGKARSSKDDDEAQENPKVELKVDAEVGEALAESQAVGKAEAGSKEQSPRRQTTKKKPVMKTMKKCHQSSRR